MTTHLVKPGPVNSLSLRCGMVAASSGEQDFIGSEDGIGEIDCAGCLRGLIISMRLEGIGPESPENLWVAGGDTGTSSLTIWSVMTGRRMPGGRYDDVPHDPSDFGRCHRLLDMFPAWRLRLAEVSASYPGWSGLIECWPELTELYLGEHPGGRAPKLWARMKQARGES